MKVLMTADAAGGVWTYACELIRGLAPHGVRFALATMGGRLPEDRRLEARALPGTELHESAYRLEWMDDPWDDVEAAGEWLLALERRVGADLVHLNGYAHGPLPWRSPVVVVAHSCVETWWRAVRGGPAPPRYERYREMVRRGLGAADAVVSPTAAHWRAVGAAYGDVGDARVVHNGLDPGSFATEAGECRFLGVGRLWDEAKNLATLERIAPRLPWPVVLAGAAERPGGETGEPPLVGGAATAGEALPGDAGARGGAVPTGTGIHGGTASSGDTAASAGVAARRLGRLRPGELRRWYAASAVLVHPARYEPFGLAPLEAALSGCALVLGDLPPLREVWGEAARYVDPADEAALERTLHELSGDPAGRRALAARARRRGRELSRTGMAAGYLALYRELTSDAELAVGSSSLRTPSRGRE